MPARPESSTSADNSSGEDQNLVSDDDELEFRGQSSSYQAPPSTLRRPDMWSMRTECSIDSED